MNFEADFTLNLPVITRRSLLICDLEGTLYDDRHRLRAITYPDDRASKADYSVYHAHFEQDLVCENLARYLENAVLEKTPYLFFWTVRPDAYHDRTQQKLADDLGVKESDFHLIQGITPATEDFKDQKFKDILAMKRAFSVNHIVLFDNMFLIHQKVAQFMQTVDDIHIDQYLVDVKGLPPKSLYYQLKLTDS